MAIATCLNTLVLVYLASVLMIDNLCDNCDISWLTWASHCIVSLNVTPNIFIDLLDCTNPPGVARDVTVGVSGRTTGGIVMMAVFVRFSFNLLAFMYRSSRAIALLDLIVIPCKSKSEIAMYASST